MKQTEKKVYIKKCKHCGKEFETTITYKVFCNDKCRANYNRDKVKVERKVYDRICPVCGKEFKTDRVNKIYCTTKCMNKHKIRKRRGITESDYEKVCPICGKSFHAFRRTEIFCSRDCYRKNYEEVNKSRLIENRKVYRETNKELIKERKKKYYNNNKDVISEKGKIKYIENKESIKKRTKEYYKENKAIIKQRTKEYNKTHRQENLRRAQIRYKTDTNYRLRKKCREMIKRCLSQKKEGRTSSILGYTSEELKGWLEKQFYRDMNWENYSLWEIHHIRPLDTFNFINEDGTDNYDVVREANALSNLTPLFKEDHRKITCLYASEKKYLETVEEIMRYVNGENNA